ncbi:MAG: WYL domain-containing protein [Cyclobacteriaceae bacterium]
MKKLRANPYCSYVELRDYIFTQIEYLQMRDDTLELSFSKRNFLRDKKEISNLFGITIEYSYSMKGYFIQNSENENLNFQRMLDAFDIFNSLNLANDLKPYVHLEKQKPLGTENLFGLLHAIKNRFTISFLYQKFWEDKGTIRRVEPIFIKEFKNRWYLLAKDNKDNLVKTFALDRLDSLSISNRIFSPTNDFDIEDYFRYSFGIIGSDGNQPEIIILSFSPFQGKYIKSLPIHQSQTILIDDHKELRISLKLCITHDLVMELLSFGSDVKVVAPKTLLNKVKKIHEESVKLYK